MFGVFVLVLLCWCVGLAHPAFPKLLDDKYYHFAGQMLGKMLMQVCGVALLWSDECVGWFVSHRV